MTRSFPQIEAYLQTTVGLDPEATPGMIGRAVDRILSEKKITDSTIYLRLLKSSQTEFDHLLERVLVPETWFFRYPDSYNCLRRYVTGREERSRKIRILSVPCSTGEEPYSIAITLMEAGLAPEHFAIDAADVSATALQKARMGRYTQNSFRGSDPGSSHRYFEKQNEQFVLVKRIRDLVNFFQWNVQDSPPSKMKSRYDIIFCRNLFIYFHRAAQTKMITTLKQLVDPKGLLFAGHAEAGPLLSPAFLPVPPMKAFVHIPAPPTM